ncbi:MAG: hypothetical protein NC332_00200 [Firmicutes bacterium]|nr:hypothetical protein [Bacillota bacterium]
MEIFIVGCATIIIFALGTFVMMIRPMDIYLNYSMKKKIKTKKIPLYFPSDRANESLYGPSLENPNEGTYLPAFISSLVTYILAIVLLILHISLYFALKDELITNVMTTIIFVVMLSNAVVCLILRERYKKIYFKHKDEYIDKIIAIKSQQNNQCDGSAESSKK